MIICTGSTIVLKHAGSAGCVAVFVSAHAAYGQPNAGDAKTFLTKADCKSGIWVVTCDLICSLKGRKMSGRRTVNGSKIRSLEMYLDEQRALIKRLEGYL
jgi:hypothetical protein